MSAHGLFRRMIGSVPDDPFYLPRKRLWLPPEMVNPPAFKEEAAPAPVQQRYALLINPFYPKSPHGSFGKHVLTPTLALTSIAGATPAHWQVRYWDENLLQGPPPCAPTPEVVRITVHLTFARRACELARYFRARGSKIVMGGLHTQCCPEELEAYADALAIGNGVTIWPQILRDAEIGNLQARYFGTFESAYDAEPPPRRDLLPRESFLTTASAIATRGCHNRCGFCYLSTKGLQMPYRMRAPRDVRNQLEAEKQPYAVFIDNNLGGNKTYLRALCQELRGLNMIWSAAVTLDVTDDHTLVREMALAGCNGVFIGFESLRDENLARARKRTPRAEEYGRRVGLLHDHGIQVNGSFVLGFDADDKDTFPELAGWIESNRLECSTFHILTPYPGTPLFRQMEAEGRLLHRNWNFYDTAHVVFRPLRMSAEQLQLGYDWMYRRLFSHQSIWRRRPAALSALPGYLAGCYLYKRSNRVWHWLIRKRLVRRVWRPLVQLTRWQHLAFRKQLQAGLETHAQPVRSVISAGV
jgi:radical SAM superfamily enzyme YgiQ (UPF0313 family)